MSNFFFISYAHEDEEFVQSLIYALGKQGFQIWIDKQNIIAGKNWPGQIVDAIKGCQGFIAVISKNSVISDSVAGELASARKNRKNIIPIVLDDSDIPARFEYQLGDIQYVDFHYYGFEVGISKVVEAVKSLQLLTMEEDGSYSKKRVFICYKRNGSPDQDLANYLSQRLQEKGHITFMDAVMRSGDNWLERIDIEIKESDFLVVLISKDSANSEMVQAEVRRAYNYRRAQGHPHILPIRIAFEDLLPYTIDAFINPFQYIIWRKDEDTERVGFELLNAISGGLPNKVPATPRMNRLITLSGDGAQVQLEDELAAPLPEFDPRILNELERAGGTVKLSDRFYIERSEDRRLKQEIAPMSRNIVTIKAPRQTGKSSLLVRGLKHARERGKTVVHLSAEVIDKDHLQNLDSFLRYVAEFILEKLRLDVALVDKSWKGGLSPSVKLTSLFEDVILSNIDALVLAMDEIDTLLTCSFYEEFFSLIRLWYNKGADTSDWNKLNVIMVVGTEPYLLIPDVNRSPFNVGINLNLKDFSRLQVSDLNNRHGAPLNYQQLENLYLLLGGHPYLTRKALYALAKENISWDDLNKTASTDHGLFGDHLKNYMFHIRDNVVLLDGIKSVVNGQKNLSDNVSYRLEKAGIIRNVDGNFVFRCQLYQSYFQEKMTNFFMPCAYSDNTISLITKARVEGLRVTVPMNPRCSWALP